MQSKRRVIVGWRQVPVQKTRSRTGRPIAKLAVGADPGSRTAVDADGSPAESHAPESPDPDK